MSAYSESRRGHPTMDLATLRASLTKADMAEWDDWREQEGNGGIMSLPEAYHLGRVTEAAVRASMTAQGVPLICRVCTTYTVDGRFVCDHGDRIENRDDGHEKCREAASGWEILYRTELRRNSLDAVFVKALVAAADKVEHEKFCRRRWPTMNERACTCVRKDLDAALEAFPREEVQGA